MDYLKFFVLPERGGIEIAIFVLRVIAIPLFFAWPLVLYTSIFAFDDPHRNFSLTALAVLLLLAYPLYISGLWIAGESLKNSAPLAAVLLTAIPAMVVVFLASWFTYSHFHSKSVFNDRAAAREKTSLQIRDDVQRGHYQDAFSNYLKPGGLNDEEFLAETFNFPAVIASIPVEKVNKDLVVLVMKFTAPGLNGIPAVHWRNSRRDMVYASSEMLNILVTWKKAGVKVEGLSYPQRWLWGHIELYWIEPNPPGTMGRQLRPIEQVFKDENPVLKAMLDYDAAKALANSPDLKSWINKKGPVFGTPLHALIVHNGIAAYPATKVVQILIEQGAQLAPDEMNDETRALLVQ